MIFKITFTFQILLKKAKQLLEDGASSIALMLDDIPKGTEFTIEDVINKYGDYIFF